MDKHNAWQREFTLLLKLFSQWLKSCGLRTDSLLEVIARLHHMAQREPASLMLLTSDQALRLRFLEAVCRQTAAFTRVLSAEALAWSGLRTWTFDITMPVSVQLEINTFERAATAGEGNATFGGKSSGGLWHPSDSSAMAQALAAVREYAAQHPHPLDRAPTAQDQGAGNMQSLQAAAPRAGLAAWHCHINVHHTAFHQELSICECPVHRLRSNEYTAISHQSHTAQHYLWIVNAEKFKAELETEIFYSLLRESLKKGKTLWLAVYRAVPANNKKTVTDLRNAIDPEVKEWALGLGLPPENMIALYGDGATTLDVGPVADLIQKNIVLARRMRWRTDMHAHIGQLHHQVYAQLADREAAYQLANTQAVAQALTDNRSTEKAQYATAAMMQELQAVSDALHVMREAQLKLRTKVWAALDNTNALLGATRTRNTPHTVNRPEQLKTQLLEWFAAAQRSLDTTAALLRAGASILAPEIQKLGTEKSTGALLPQLPDLRLQLARLTQHKLRVSGKSLRWESLTMPEAYEQTRIFQIALDSIVETVRAMVTQWFGEVLLIIDRHQKANVVKQAQMAARVENAPTLTKAKSYALDTERAESVRMQKIKLDEQIALLNATVMDALPLAGESSDLSRPIQERFRSTESPPGTLQPIRRVTA